jgi:hypothetical protein
MKYYGMQPTWDNIGITHEKGNMEQFYFRFKMALDQALQVRDRGDFSDRATHERLVQDLVWIRY